MPITSSREIAQGRGSGITVRSSRQVRTATRVFRVSTDTVHDGTYILANGSLALPDALPSIAAQHPSTPAMSVVGIDPRQEDVDGRSWLVTVSYDDETDTSDATETNPLDRGVRYHMEQATFTRVVRWDVDGFPIANTINDEFDQPLEEEDCSTILVANKNYALSDFNSIVSIARAYKNTLNADEFYGCPPGTVRFIPLTMSEPQRENDVSFYAVTFRFELREDEDAQAIWSQLGSSAMERQPGPWDRIVLNTGRYAYKTADDGTTKYKLKDSEPQKLKQDGRLIVDADIIDFFYRVFSTKRRMPFSILGV